jgi:hypothetical protein
LSAAEVALDQAPEQVVDLHAMVTHDLGDRISSSGAFASGGLAK